MRYQSGTSKWKSCDSVTTISEKEVALMEKKHSEEEKTSLDSPSPKLNKSMIAYHETGDLFADTCEIVESAQSIAYAAVDTILVQRNWLLGKRIAIECLNENGSGLWQKNYEKAISRIKRKIW